MLRAGSPHVVYLITSCANFLTEPLRFIDKLIVSIHTCLSMEDNLYFLKCIPKKRVLCLIVFIICANAINAQDDYESVDSKLSSHIIQYISNGLLKWDSSFEPSWSWFSGRNEIINLFLEAFNDRHHINIRLGDPEDYLRQRQLREEAFRLLNNTIHFQETGGASDGQDAREITFRDTVSFMTLGLLSPNSFQHRFFNLAKSFNYGNSWYSYPRQYTVVVLLEVLLQFERVQGNRWLQRNPRSLSIQYERIIENLQELVLYLSGIIESEAHDEGYWIEEDIRFINGIIQQMKYNVIL